MAAHPNFVESSARLRSLLEQTRTIAVLGIKTEAQGEQAAYYVPQYLQASGYDVIPVPVYYPQATEILGRKVYRKLADIPQLVDLVNVFRRPADIPPHVEDILAKKPRAVWFQLGIRNDQAALELAAAGIQVVQDRCIMVDHRTLLGDRR
ncbi:MAG: CoA-binding protein [Betaproteobacteria bacterium]|nr:CoA-binding protein [Betaproteobacteria bacterium]